MSSFERRIIVGMIIGVMIYAAIGIYVDASALLSELTRLDPLVFIGALGLSCINYGFRWAKWEYFLRVLDVRIPAGRSVAVFLSGLSMSITPGKLGEVLKSVLLRESDDLPVAKTAPIVVAERLTDLLGLLVIAGVGVSTFSYGEIPLVVTLVGVLAILILVQSPRLVAAMLDIVEKLPVVGKLRPKLDEAYASTRELMGARSILPTTLMSVFSWSFEAFAFWWILDSMGSEASVLLVFFIFAVGTIIGAISFLPGGLGVTEGTMIGALIVLGACTDEAQATAATYVIRFATLWFGCILGFVALITFRRVVAKSA